MHVKELYSWVFIHIIFIISLTTFNPSLKQGYHNGLPILMLPKWIFMDYLSAKIGPPYIATNHYNKQTHNKEKFVGNKIIIFSRFNYPIGFGLYEYYFQS